MNKLQGLVFGSLFVVGCGTDTPGQSGPEVLPDLTVPPVPENGVQIITPIVTDIQPGSDNEICTWTDVILDKTTDIRSTLSFQTEPPGHHVVVYYTSVHQPAGTQRPCSDTDMATFRYLTGNGTNGEINEAPGNLVFRAPAGSQIVINHHYLNATESVLKGQVALNVNFADPGNYVPSGAAAIVDTAIQVPIGASSWDIHCELQRDLKYWYFIPHMHRWGSHITIDTTHAGEKTRMFDTIWNDAFTFHPPEKRMDPATPMILKQGDAIDVHCEWNNDTDKVLGFGFEMCVGFGQFVDDEQLGNVACDGGNWVPF